MQSRDGSKRRRRATRFPTAGGSNQRTGDHCPPRPPPCSSRVRRTAMDDRELLELAARATGFEIEDDENRGLVVLSDCGVEWNPLTDDGDALRLAVRLQDRKSTRLNSSH